MLKNNVVEGIYFGKISYCVTVSFQLNFFLFSDPLDDKVDIEINNIYIKKRKLWAFWLHEYFTWSSFLSYETLFLHFISIRFTLNRLVLVSTSRICSFPHNCLYRFSELWYTAWLYLFIGGINMYIIVYCHHTQVQVICLTVYGTQTCVIGTYIWVNLQTQVDPKTQSYEVLLG